MILFAAVEGCRVLAAHGVWALVGLEAAHVYALLPLVGFLFPAVGRQGATFLHTLLCASWVSILDVAIFTFSITGQVLLLLGVTRCLTVSLISVRLVFEGSLICQVAARQGLLYRPFVGTKIRFDGRLLGGHLLHRFCKCLFAVGSL